MPEMDISPAAEPTTPLDGSAMLESWTSEQRDEWFKTGETPPAAVADSAPAVEPEVPASTDASAQVASEPTAPAKPQKNAETRIQELLAERHAERVAREQAERKAAALEARLSQPKTPPAGSSPAPAKPDLSTYDAYLQSHPDATYEAFIEARVRGAIQAELATREQQQRAQAERETLTRAQQDRAEKFRAAITDATKADPEFISKVSPEVLSLKPLSALLPGEQATVRHAIAEELLTSPVAPQLMRHFTDHPEVLSALEASPSPAALLKAFGKLEASLSHDAITPPTPQITTAPNPPTTLGRKPATPVDEAEAALKRGDFSAYEKAANAAELARRK